MFNLFSELCKIPKNSKNSAKDLSVDKEDEMIKEMIVALDGA